MKRKKIEDIKKKPSCLLQQEFIPGSCPKLEKLDLEFPSGRRIPMGGGELVYKGPKRGKNLMKTDLHKEEAIKVDGFPNKSEHVALIDSRS
jgi:hypothetical protein